VETADPAEDMMEKVYGEDTRYGTMNSDDVDCVDVDMFVDDSHSVVGDDIVGNGIGAPEP
jgi:hypothetical protein